MWYNIHAALPEWGEHCQGNDEMKKKILMLTTGGTMASGEMGDGLAPRLSGEELLALCPGVRETAEIDVEPVLSIDSSNMQPEHWVGMAEAIRDHYDSYDGFVICHGTDTMAYTAAVLSYLIRDSEKPIVLTGAQRPIGFEITDAKSNLQDSILYAADSRSRGVQIVFAGKVIAGTRARKVRSMSYAAFASINLPEIALINNGQIVRYLTDEAFCKPGGSGSTSGGAYQRQANFCTEIDPNVFLLKLTPGMKPDLLREIFRLYDAIVIESFGAGGIPQSLEQTLFEELGKYRPEEKVLAMTTQVTYEGSHLETYEVARRIADAFQILEARDMTLEAAMAKLMGILADRDQSWEEIRRRFYEPVALDILTA